MTHRFHRFKKSPWYLNILLIYLILISFALTGLTAARFRSVDNFDPEIARAAKYDIDVTVTGGFESETSDSVTFLSIHAQPKSYTFTVTNNSEVTVSCTPQVRGDNLPDHTFTLSGGTEISGTSFPLDPGQSQSVVLSVSPAQDPSQMTQQHIDVDFVTVQID